MLIEILRFLLSINILLLFAPSSPHCHCSWSKQHKHFHMLSWKKGETYIGLSLWACCTLGMWLKMYGTSNTPWLDSSSSDAPFLPLPVSDSVAPWQQQQHLLPRTPSCFLQSFIISVIQSFPSTWHNICLEGACTCHVKGKKNRQMVWMGERAGNSFTSSRLVSLCMPANTRCLQSQLALSQKLSSGSTNSLNLCSFCISFQSFSRGSLDIVPRH